MSERLRVCVTGSARGIGRAIALAYLERGASVAMNHRRVTDDTEKDFGTLAEQHPGRVLPVLADVTDRAQVKSMFAAVKGEWGGLDVLVNNAGHNQDGLALMMSDEAWRSVIDTDLTGAFNCAREAAWMMASRRSGSIITIASVSAFTAPAGQANYAAAKAGVVALTRTLAKELASKNVRVNAVAPGLISTDMIDSLSPKALEAYLEHIPQRRVGTPQEVFDAVEFLASEKASYVTGHCLIVDGGLVA